MRFSSSPSSAAGNALSQNATQMLGSRLMATSIELSLGDGRWGSSEVSPALATSPTLPSPASSIGRNRR